MKFKQIILFKPFLYIIGFIYSILHGNFLHILNNSYTLRYKGAFLNTNRYKVKGNNNLISIGSKARLKNCIFTIIGDNCKIIIGGGSTIVTNVHFWCQDDNSTIIIGNDFTMESGHIASTEGKIIEIGNDCMFSNDVEIRNGDSHSIIDIQSNCRINYANNVTIGDHVWLSAHSRVLKGSKVPSYSIIGNSSIVTSVLVYENSIYAGIPAKLVKTNINWNRVRLL